MSRQKLVKLLKYSTLGAAVGGSAYFLQKNDWEMSTIGVVRFSRSALTAVSIVADYKKSLRNLEYNTDEYKKTLSEVHTRSALKMRDLCCANGGAYIKVGQHMGTLDYLLPEEYVRTMKVLHSRAPQSPITDLYRVFEEDLGKKIEDVFVAVDPEPLGTASLAQVHKAVTRDGQVLAVKIQHPKVKAHSYVDIKTMEFLIHRVAWVFPNFQYIWLAEETKKNLPRELDFFREGQHCERVAKLYKHFNFLKLPKIHWELTSERVLTMEYFEGVQVDDLTYKRQLTVPKIHWELTSERVLTMEYCEGGQVDDLAYMQKHNINVNEVMQKLGRLYSEMIFVNGYVHCDPHPGNVLVNRTSAGQTQIVLLDHGLYQTLTDDFRVNYSKLWMSLLDANIEGIKKYSQRLNVGRLFPLFACMLTARSWESISHGIDKKEFTKEEGQEIKDNVSTYMIEITEVLNQIPRQLLLILKTNDVLRGIETSLKIRANASSFINMSKCCIRAVEGDRLRQCSSRVTALKIRLSMYWQLWKIELYEFYLWIGSSSLAKWWWSNRNQKPALTAS